MNFYYLKFSWKYLIYFNVAAIATNMTDEHFHSYRITSECSDLYVWFGCYLHYATLTPCALGSKNHSTLEVIQKVIRYALEQYKQCFRKAPTQNPLSSTCAREKHCFFRYCSVLYISVTLLVNSSSFFLIKT